MIYIAPKSAGPTPLFPKINLQAYNRKIQT